MQDSLFTPAKPAPKTGGTRPQDLDISILFFGMMVNTISSQDSLVLSLQRNSKEVQHTNQIFILDGRSMWNLCNFPEHRATQQMHWNT